MIETKDSRKFFTQRKNYTQLIEFANTFDAEISLVRLEDGDILDLGPLAEAISNNADPGNGRFTLVRKIIELKKKKNMGAAYEVKEWIKTCFSEGKVVNFKDLRGKFQKHNLSYNALYSHFASVRKKLQEQGLAIEKIGPGQYQLARK
jgi:hypothetical protein